MSNQCNQCGSYAINHHHHGRDGSDPDLCDVCYWHTRHDQLQAELAALKAKTAVPDGWQLVPKKPTPEMRTAAISVEIYADSPAIADCLTWAEAEAIYKGMLAAAPAQPAAQEDPLHITHRPLIRNAISLLRLRQPVAPDVARVADDLEAMLDGQPTPAGEPSDAWLQVAEQVDQQEELHVWRATTRYGETCHFGEASIASAWAGENGTVERVELTPVPELRLVERQEQEEVQRLREALDSCLELIETISPFEGDTVRKARAALSASTAHQQQEGE